MVLNFLLSCGESSLGADDEDSCIGTGCGFFSQPGNDQGEMRTRFFYSLILQG